MSTRNRWRARAPRQWLIAALALLTPLSAALTGCAGAEPSVVAYVGDTRITQTQLDQAVDGVSSTLEEGQQVAPQAVVNVLIIGEIASQLAAEQSIDITDAQREDLIETGNLAPLLDVPAARPLAFDFADQNIVAERLGPEAFVTELGRREVTLNPRFGTLDPQTKQIREATSGSLSVPAAEQ